MTRGGGGGEFFCFVCRLRVIQILCAGYYLLLLFIIIIVVYVIVAILHHADNYYNMILISFEIRRGVMPSDSKATMNLFIAFSCKSLFQWKFFYENKTCLTCPERVFSWLFLAETACITIHRTWIYVVL